MRNVAFVAMLIAAAIGEGFRQARVPGCARRSLTVPGTPVPLERHRTRAGRAYLPRRSAAYRALVQQTWMLAGAARMGAQPIAATMRFYRRRDADLDNMVKAVLDALNGLAFDDDRQVQSLSACKVLGARVHECAEVELEAIG